MTAPQISVHTFPYRRKWTKDELDSIYERFERLKFVLTDAVGPTGQQIFLPPDAIAILALHAALAGADVDDDAAFIWGRIRPDEQGIFEGAIEWLVKKDNPPPPEPEPDAARSEAQVLAGQIKRQIPPEVREALVTILADEYQTEIAKNEVSKREKADNVLAEDKLRQMGGER